VSVVEGDALVCSLGPVVDKNASGEARASFQEKVHELLEDFRVCILEHGRNNVLLKGRQVLSNHAVYAMVLLLPQLL